MIKFTFPRLLLSALVFSAALALTTPVFAKSEHGHSSHGGEPGKASNATRIVRITIGDNFFKPESLEVKADETIRFVIRNDGELLHEFNIGTPKMHTKHQKEMAIMMEQGMLTPTGINHEMSHMDHSKMGMAAMKHEDSNSVLIEPSKTKNLLWTFPKSGKLEFACNIPGHYESGMVGEITVKNN